MPLQGGLNRSQAIASLQPFVERARHFSGWSFPKDSWRRLGAPPPWNYESLASHAAKSASTVIDMGTGGGELLAKLSGALPAQTIATEEWSVNVPVAKKRLNHYSIEVVHCRSVQLPFKDACFDLVLNRHEELDPREVARVLAPGAKVITQQVGRNNWKELWNYFPRTPGLYDHLESYADGFRQAGLKVLTNLSHDYKVAYGILGDFVYMLAVTPWTIPGFSLERDIDSLLSLDRDCRTENGLELTECRTLLIAQKPRVT